MFTYSQVINQKNRLTIDRRLKVGKSIENIVYEENLDLLKKRKLYQEFLKQQARLNTKEEWNVKTFVPEVIVRELNIFDCEIKQRKKVSFFDVFIFNLFSPITKLIVSSIFLIFAIFTTVAVFLSLSTAFIIPTEYSFVWKILTSIFWGFVGISCAYHFYLWV